MILLGDKLVKQEQFGDGTLKCTVPEDLEEGLATMFGFMGSSATKYITWLYDNDAELFTLQCLVDTIREKLPGYSIILKMPYIPHARQDRWVSNRMFTLKTFAKLINNMNFKRVEVLDPHSDVSCALIDRLYKETNLLHKVVYELQTKTSRYEDFTEIADASLMFPDAGAAKK